MNMYVLFLIMNQLTSRSAAGDKATAEPQRRERGSRAQTRASRAQNTPILKYANLKIRQSQNTPISKYATISSTRS